MAAYTHDSSFFSRRAIVFVFACAVQVLIFVALDYGLVNKALNAPPQPIQTNIVQQVQKKDLPPPPPPPKMERPPVEVPPPEVAINVPVETNSTAITGVTDKKVPPPPRPAPHRIVYTAARLDIRDSPTTDDYYPPVSRRLGEQGTAVVHVCTDPNGRVDGQPTISRGSGSRRLDQAAVRWASHARFSPGTADGRPMKSCTRFAVVFRLVGDDD
ncbi:MAG: energy transducer TonB [Steroidobacteraceae bacterium]